MVNLYRKWDANGVVVERNYGGDMCRFTIHAVDPRIPVKVITASKSKHVRAEPVSVLYEKRKVIHVGYFNELEEQLTNFSSVGYEGDKSPDRADALIWAVTDLMVKDMVPIVATGRYEVRA